MRENMDTFAQARRSLRLPDRAAIAQTPAPAGGARPPKLGSRAWSAVLHQKVYPPLKIAALARVLAECGIPVAQALAGTGLSEVQIGLPQTRCSIQQLLIMGRNALRLSERADLGLQAGLQMHASAYGMYGYAMLCAETLRHGFDLAVRYHPLATPVMALHWERVGDLAIWSMPLPEQLRHLDLSAAEYQFFLDMQFAQHTTLIKDVMGPGFTPLRVLYAVGEPPHAQAIAAGLGGPVCFDQPRNELHYPAAWLDRTPHLSNPITAAQMSITCAQLVQELKLQAGVSGRVVDELMRVPGRFPEINQIAAALGMGPRTLRRRLESEGTSFTDLLVNVRHALAVDYLGTTSLSIEDIAIALGFSDTASFRHAFKRWSGMTPSKFRIP